MGFLVLVIIAIFLYILNYKHLAFIFFFFFLTSGFNLVPEELTDIGFISKGSDFAFFILSGIIIIDSFCIRKYWKPDRLTGYLLAFGSFLILCIFYSKWIVGLGWSEIIRTCRYQFFWLAYFIFRNMEKAQLEKLLRFLFDVTVVLSVLFLLQIMLDVTILNETVIYKIGIFGMVLPRYYNQPDMIQFFTLMAIYHNPHKGWLKICTTVLLILALLSAFHRSLFGMLLITLLLAYALKLPRLQKIRFFSVLAFLLVCGISFTGLRFMHSRTFMDLQHIAEGNFAEAGDIDAEDFEKSTFTFRIALLYERNQYIMERPQTMLLGAGLIPEDSPKTKMFDFKIGLLDEITDEVIQTETGDISYANLIFKLGYIGTALYLLLLIYLAVFFYKKRDNKYGMLSFLFLIFSFGVSFFSGNLLLPATYLLPLITYVIIQKTDSRSDPEYKLL
ncbi:MAG: hypothetical protein LBT25_04035 [Candidatus Symbiothrix sp.]|jgi:hypothetical protein|nr:hypothetical protein [Candidatus Symbiothrix sp.]